MKHTHQAANIQGERRKSLAHSRRSRRHSKSLHQHTTFWIMGAVIAALGVFSAFVISQNSTAAAAEQPASQVVHAPAQRAISPIVGIQAIRPTKTYALPSFSVADVITYSSGKPLAHTLVSSSLTSANMTVQFLPSKEVSARLFGEPTGLPDSTLLCLVITRGTFTFSGPEGTTVTYPIGYEVFDARTGNLLMWGGLPSSV